jgi:hypothetical protein
MLIYMEKDIIVDVLNYNVLLLLMQLDNQKNNLLFQKW